MLHSKVHASYKLYIFHTMITQIETIHMYIKANIINIPCYDETEVLRKLQLDFLVCLMGQVDLHLSAEHLLNRLNPKQIVT